MARKTAMGKEPGKVSIAIPQSEKNRLNQRNTPKTGGPGLADRAMDGAKPLPLKRLSPGVYRNSAGQLVGSKGQTLPGQKQQSLTEQALNAANRAMNDDRRSQIQSSAQNVVQTAGMEGNRMPAGRPGQQMPQQDADAAMQARDLASQFENMQGSVDDIMRNRFGQNQQFVPYPSQIQSGYHRAPPGQAPMIMQDLMYRYPPGTQMPNLYEAMQRAPQVQQQPNTISGLLRRGR